MLNGMPRLSGNRRGSCTNEPAPSECVPSRCTACDFTQAIRHPQIFLSVARMVPLRHQTRWFYCRQRPARYSAAFRNSDTKCVSSYVFIQPCFPPMVFTTNGSEPSAEVGKRSFLMPVFQSSRTLVMIPKHVSGVGMHKHGHLYQDICVP